ncbi:MAG TPA: VWA domain-containing protein [Syntrophales bacterium]|nr:VWA domain-containing protein [Syntrophales bacterium]
MKSCRGILLRGYRQCRLSGERGAFMVIFALMLLVILGFTALGVEAGRWYLVRAELAKGVDAAALVAAKNISNPYVSPTVLAEEFGVENFHAGYIGTPGAGTGTVKFTATMVESDKVRVTGDVRATAVLAKLFGIDTIPVNAVSMAQKKEVEIMMILDRSGSMGNPGTKMSNLKSAAISFLGFFEDTQDRDKVGLISFSTTVSVDRALGTDFVNPMKTAINAMTANGATNMEDAFDQADGPSGFTDQTGVPGDKRLQQFVVFFSDGMPTALRDKFKYNDADYDGVVYGEGTNPNCRPSDYPNMSVHSQLHKTTGTNNFYSGVTANVTGDGKASGASVCPGGTNTTKWYLFQTRPVPRTGGGVYGAEACNIPHDRTKAPFYDDLLPYFCQTARQLTLDNAKILKDKGIKIYVIGLGSSTEIDEAFLESLSSGSNYTYITPNSSELESIFNKIAKEIKLRLVQ